MEFSIHNDVAILALDETTAQCDVGTTNPSATLNIYSGTPPTRAKDPLSGNTLLAALPMTNPAFGAAVDDGNNRAAATANPITTAAAVASGTATFCRVVDRDDSVVQQGDVTLIGGGGFLELSRVDLLAGADVPVDSMIWRLPELNVI